MWTPSLANNPVVELIMEAPERLVLAISTCQKRAPLIFQVEGRTERVNDFFLLFLPMSSNRPLRTLAALFILPPFLTPSWATR